MIYVSSKNYKPFVMKEIVSQSADTAEKLVKGVTDLAETAAEESAAELEEEITKGLENIAPSSITSSDTDEKSFESTEIESEIDKQISSILTVQYKYVQT